MVPIEVIYVRDSLDSTAAGFGFLVAAWGVGIVLGSLLYLVVKSHRASTLIIASTAAIGVAYCGMSVATTLAVACLLAVLGGTGNGIQWIAVVTGLQEATPIELQARVVGLLESLNAALPGVGFLVGAVIATLASPRTAYAVAGIGVLVLVLLALIFRRFVPENSIGPADAVVLPGPTGASPGTGRGTASPLSLMPLDHVALTVSGSASAPPRSMPSTSGSRSASTTTSIF